MAVRSWTLVLVCVFLLTVRSAADEEENVYSFTVKDIQGKNVSLSDYKGKVSSCSLSACEHRSAFEWICSSSALHLLH